VKPDIRIRIRSRIIRIHVGETCIRAIIRIRAGQRGWDSDSHFFRFTGFALRFKAEAKPERRRRKRSRITRIHVGETRMRASIRIRAGQRGCPTI